MSDLICPLCQQRAMAFWKKVLLSPLAAAPCESCDYDIKVSWRSYLLAISPGSILFVLAYLLLEQDSLLQYLGYASGFVLMLLGQLLFMTITAAPAPLTDSKDDT